MYLNCLTTIRMKYNQAQIMHILKIKLLRCKKNTWISTGYINSNIVTSFIVKMLNKISCKQL